MKNFSCSCGQTLFFENTHCLKCGKQVGFDPGTLQMYAIHSGAQDSSGTVRLLCRNASEFDVCNWFTTDAGDEFCLSCNLNHTIPNLLEPGRRSWWKSLEQAKRRLIYSLLSLQLPVVGKGQAQNGLAFKFIEDQRTNPRVWEEFVSTGHENGLITINIAEADHVKRELSRQYTGEQYRTLLGHFRHEAGHYYFDRLVKNSGAIESFRALFGDEREDYTAALQEYYANKASMHRNPDLISHYAQAHPLEDWAEVWSHYLHMADTLETAAEYDMHQGSKSFDDINRLVAKWSQLSMMLNSLNRSMGLEDAYPFVLSDLTLKKLRFVHGLIYPSL